MVNQEIYQGIKYALSKKQSLRDAMMSFYNAGYKKQDIEEAARKIQLEEYEAKYNAPAGAQTAPISKVEKPKAGFFSKFKTSKPEEKIPEKKPEPRQRDFFPTQKKIEEKKKEVKPLSQPYQNRISSINFPKKEYKIPDKPLQKISKYGEEKPKKDWLTIFLIIFLLLLVGVLVAVFLFKQEILNFLKNLF